MRRDMTRAGTPTHEHAQAPAHARKCARRTGGVDGWAQQRRKEALHGVVGCAPNRRRVHSIHSDRAQTRKNPLATPKPPKPAIRRLNDGRRWDDNGWPLNRTDPSWSADDACASEGKRDEEMRQTADCDGDGHKSQALACTTTFHAHQTVHVLRKFRKSARVGVDGIFESAHNDFVVIAGVDHKHLCKHMLCPEMSRLGRSRVVPNDSKHFWWPRPGSVGVYGV